MTPHNTYWNESRFNSNWPTVLCIPDLLDAKAFLDIFANANANIILLMKSKWQSSTSVDMACGFAIVAESFTAENSLTALKLLLDLAKLPTRSLEHIVCFTEQNVEICAALSDVFAKDPWQRDVLPLFRDKFLMRSWAKSRGILSPDFALASDKGCLEKIFSQTTVTEKVSGPRFVTKPRTSMLCDGVQLWNDIEGLNQWLENLGDGASEYLVERYQSGSLCHVDAIVKDGRSLVSIACRYGCPLINVDGVENLLTDVTLDADSILAIRLKAAHEEVVAAFGLVSGMTHIEFFLDHQNGEISLCEAACRPPGFDFTKLHELVLGESLFSLYAKALLGIDISYVVTRGNAGLVSFGASQANAEFRYKIEKIQHADIVTRKCIDIGQLPANLPDLLYEVGRILILSESEMLAWNAIRSIGNQYKTGISEVIKPIEVTFDA